MSALVLPFTYGLAHFTLASRMRNTTVEDLIEESELEPWTAYLSRARGGGTGEGAGKA